MASHHEHSRKIQERLHISGQLVLQTPAHFGGGQNQTGDLMDMALLMDEVDGKAMIPGTSIAGALRNYLRERLLGYEVREDAKDKQSKIAWLFGPTRESKEDMDQSLLIVDDALATVQGVTLRDGVRIDPKTGTAWVEEKEVDGRKRIEGAKFDMELLEAGTSFDLHFELALTSGEKGKALLPYIVAALEGFENGEIRLGARKRRGFGQCQVDGWIVSCFEVAENASELCEWLETPPTQHRMSNKQGAIATAMGTTAAPVDRRRQLKIDAVFSLDKSSVLIRSGFGQADFGPDAEHLHAGDASDSSVRRPVISGTSWAGVMRHRALRIAKTLAGTGEKGEGRAEELVKDLFGWMPEGGMDEQGWSSKLTADETEIEHGQTLYQTRVRIDRFTGGAFDGALFEQAPVYGKGETRIGFSVHVREPQASEVGLLLLVLKDLWTGDLPIGGEASVGRGRLQGVTATIVDSDGDVYELDAGKAALGLGEIQWSDLQEKYVDKLTARLNSEEEEHAEAKH